MSTATQELRPGIELGIKLDKETIEAFKEPKKRASLALNRFIKENDKKYSYEDRKYRLNKAVKLTAKCLLQGFITACHNNCLYGKFYETSTALIAHYTDSSTSAVKRHIKKLKDAGIIVEQRLNPSFTFNNNYLIRLSDWLIEELYEIVEEANQAALDKQETPEQTQARTEQAIEKVAKKIVDQVEIDDEDVVDNLEFWNSYLNKKFNDSG